MVLPLVIGAGVVVTSGLTLAAYLNNKYYGGEVPPVGTQVTTAGLLDTASKGIGRIADNIAGELSIFGGVKLLVWGAAIAGAYYIAVKKQ